MTVTSKPNFQSASSIGLSEQYEDIFPAYCFSDGKLEFSEEGARFPISMVSSGVWAGAHLLESAHNLQEVGGGKATMKSELQRIGYLGFLPASYEAMPMAAHFELHIGMKAQSTASECSLLDLI